ncbi:MAG: hypothetical protein PHP82_00015 [Candidatus ainarchaeum sp.]|nr:hypothetical protein [Candidatus ainarchaeum sp.]
MKKKINDFGRKLRLIYRNLVLPVDYSGQEVSDKIFELLNSDKPIMICRFGSVELDAVKKIDLIEKGKLKFNKNDFFQLKNNAGFFPIEYEFLKKFHDRMLEDMLKIDIYGQFSTIELYFSNLLRNKKKVRLSDLNPWEYELPWSRILKGKKVLVVYPFENSIKKQYKIREKLFENQNILPKFDLITLKSVQSIGGNCESFSNWFDALKYMEDEISKIDFDIAIIGCGAYGLLLAAYIKQIGKKAIHLGSATQILFGIKGKRWEESNFNYINKYWIRPSKSERPKGYKNVENGCYW